MLCIFHFVKDSFQLLSASYLNHSFFILDNAVFSSAVVVPLVAAPVTVLVMPVVAPLIPRVIVVVPPIIDVVIPPIVAAVNCAPAPDESIDAAIKLQSCVRQLLSSISSCTYNIFDADFLNSAVSSFRTHLKAFKSESVSSVNSYPRRIRRRFGKRQAMGSALNRRLQTLHTRKRRKKALSKRRKAHG
jgi:hypothetical protein